MGGLALNTQSSFFVAIPRQTHIYPLPQARGRYVYHLVQLGFI
jgi:hypothetical protein